MNFPKSIGPIGFALVIASVSASATAQDIIVSQASDDTPGQVLPNVASVNAIYGNDFGTVNVDGGTRQRYFYVNNMDHDTDLDLGLITVAGTHPADFSVLQPSETELPPGGGTAFRVVFNPVAAGPRSAVIIIPSTDADPDNPFVINVSGSGVNGFPVATPDLGISHSKIKAKYNKKSSKVSLKGEVLVTNNTPAPAGAASINVYSSKDDYLDSNDPLVANLFTPEITGEIQPEKPLKIKYSIEVPELSGRLYFRVTPGGSNKDYNIGNNLADRAYGVTN